MPMALSSGFVVKLCCLLSASRTAVMCGRMRRKICFSLTSTALTNNQPINLSIAGAQVCNI